MDQEHMFDDYIPINQALTGNQAAIPNVNNQQLAQQRFPASNMEMDGN